MMNSRVCIDANIVVWSLLSFPLSETAEALLRRYHQTDTVVIAPILLAYEVTSSIRRMIYLKHITLAEGEDAFARFLRIEIHLLTCPDIYPLAWDLAKEFNRSRAYDTAYMAVAQLNECDLWTADEKLYNAVHAKAPWVKWVGNYADEGK